MWCVSAFRSASGGIRHAPSCLRIEPPNSKQYFQLQTPYERVSLLAANGFGLPSTLFHEPQFYMWKNAPREPTPAHVVRQNFRGNTAKQSFEYMLYLMEIAAKRLADIVSSSRDTHPILSNRRPRPALTPMMLASARP